ncbi:LAQU0S25e00650g1_1 [Lachancea quebecensis]|uniref:LAQU0S25e00650g1_1 n=1 Tax=Lachancea quebecensis TaxID=1654605 RepID=A0A0P1KXJ1_9SACH|nr:LAQU0S25e00650g1_1 [Lachancea quebecensis]
MAEMLQIQTNTDDYNAFRMERFLNEGIDGLRAPEGAGAGRLAKAMQMARRWSNGSAGVRSGGSAPGSASAPYSMTPSMSSVLSQVRFNSRSRRASPRARSGMGMSPGLDSSACASASYSSSGSVRSAHSIFSVPSFDYALQGSAAMMREDSLDEWHCGLCAPDQHPLEAGDSHGNGNAGTAAAVAAQHAESCSGQPNVRLVNPQDLDLQDEYQLRDIVQLYRPVYQRDKRGSKDAAVPRRTSVDLTIDTANNVGTAQVLGPESARAARSTARRSSLIYDTDVVELENWPHGKTRDPTVGADTHRGLTQREARPSSDLPNRRTRQQTLNPNFLKLYALETNSKARNLIPDLNVDEHVLRKLSFRDIWDLQIPPTSETRGVSAHDIKLALITRKKLWSEMMCEPRSDLHGDHAPWNLHFIASTGSGSCLGSEQRAPSLVRVNSDIKPWTNLSSNYMLRPSGKLQLTRTAAGVHPRELHYVVKGWYDARFASSLSPSVFSLC